MALLVERLEDVDVAGKMFKIRKKGTNLFSSGGADPRWTPKGKTWGSIAHVKSHLAQVNQPRSGGWGSLDIANYTEAEIVEYTAVESSVTDVVVVFQQIRDTKAEKRAKKEAAARKTHEDYEREQLRHLQAKYPNG